MDLTQARNVTTELEHMLERTVGINEETGAAICPVELIEITDALESQDEDSPYTWLRPGVRVLVVYASDKDRTSWHVGLMRMIGHSGFVSSPLANINDHHWSSAAKESFERNLNLNAHTVSGMVLELAPEGILSENLCESSGPLMDLSLARNVTE